MNDLLNFKGHFKIQSIDIDGKVIDEYEERNLIMADARTSMSEIFANLTSSTFVNEFKLGTMGQIGSNTSTPKTSTEGFVKERDRLFSDPQTETVTDGTNIPTVNLNDLFYITTAYASGNGYYQYVGDPNTNLVLTQTEIEGTDWVFYGTTPPYTYEFTFTLPGTTTTGGVSATSIVETDASAGSTVLVEQTGTSVIFHIDLATAGGNSQSSGTSTFTEAALYANGRIFAMKTFAGKVKDSSILLRITWTITF